MLHRAVIAWLDFVLRHRVAMVCAVALATVASGLVCTRAVVSSSLAGLFFGDSPDYWRYTERARAFGGDDLIVIGYAEADPLGAEPLARLERAVDRVRALPDIGGVTSLLDVQRVGALEDTLEIDGYADRARAAPDRRAAVLKEMMADPFAGGTLVARDGRAAAVLVELEPDPRRPGELVPAVLTSVVEAFVAEGFDRDDLHTGGFPAAVAETISQAYRNLGQLFPVSLAVLLATVWLLFRRLWPVAITGLIGLVAVVWTLGFTVLIDPKLSIMTTLLPGIVLIISFSDVVHLCSAYLNEISSGRPRDEALRASGAEVGAACLLTSVTTGVGFVSMSFIPTPMFRIAGVSMGFGVAVALLLAMTLTPIVLSWMPEPAPWRRGEGGGLQAGLDRFLAGCTRLTTARPGAILAAFSLLAALAALGLAHLEIETNFERRLDAGNRIRQDFAWLDERFSGSVLLDVYVEVPHQDGLLEPKTFARVAALQDAVAALPGVDQALSLVDLVREVHEAVGGPDAPATAGVPTTRGALAQYLLLFEMGGGERLDRLIDFERRTLRMSLRLDGRGLREAAAIGREVKRLSVAALGEVATAEPTGLQFLLGAWLDEILAGQRRGLLFAVLSIALLMIVGLGSLRVGLWSMIPNLLPIAALGGWLGLTWDQVDSDTFVIAVVALGIGVDDTIHFLMRLRIEWARQPTPADAIDAAMRYAGRGIFITTIVLTLGFLPFVLSDYFSVAIFGTLLPLCLGVALAADLLLVPALVQVGWLRFAPFPPEGGRSTDGVR